MVSTIQSRIKTFFDEKNSSEIFFICSLFLTVILGIVFRSQGYFNGNISLWLDEAEWVFKLSDRPLLKNALIRPIGFLVATRFLISIVNNEITLRLIAYSASILSIPLIYFIAREIFKSKLTIFLAVFIVSFNPVLINFAKEFKPYSLELFLHLLLLYLLLQYMKLKTTRLFYLVLCMSFVILFFAYNIVFLYPSLFLIVLCEAYKEKKIRWIFFSLLTVFLLSGLLYALYYVLWSNLDIGNARIYWGEKYDVFCLSLNSSEHSQWIAKKYLSLVERSGTATIFWDSKFNAYGIVNGVLWVVHCIGLAAFVLQRKWEYLVLLALPIVLIVSSNIMGLWPFGAFRANVFMFGYFAIISLYGIDTVITTDKKIIKGVATAIVVAVFMILQFPFELNHYTVKTPGFSTPHSNMRSVLNTIVRYELSKGSKIKRNDACVLFADYHSFFPVKYYVGKHSSLSKRYERFQANDEFRLFNIGLTCDQILKSLNKLTTDPQLTGMRAWILISKIPCLKDVNQYFRKKSNVLLMNNFGDANLLVYYQF